MLSRLSAVLLASTLMTACSDSTPEWVSAAEDAGELISLEYFQALLPEYKDRIATSCRTYELGNRFYVHCLPAPYDRFVGWGRDILMEYRDGLLYPANGTTDAAMRRFRRVRLGLPETAKSYEVLGAKIVVKFLRDGGPQPFEVLEAIEKKKVKRID